MDTFNFLMAGFAAALQPGNLLFALIGCVLGTLIGVLPGVGPAAGTAILIPLTFKLDPTGAIIMLCAIYYGAMYGGTITSVLLNVPGEAASVITCIDGFQMAKQGRGGTALGIAAIGSFIGGIAATVALVLVATPLSKLALSFGPPEFFALMLVGLVSRHGSRGAFADRRHHDDCRWPPAGHGRHRSRAGAPRFTFGVPDLYDGIGFIPVVMGLFGIGEILATAEAPVREIVKTNLSRLLPNREEWRRSMGAIARGTGIGFFLGLIPGVGAIIPTFMSYILEKRVSKNPEQFGKGAIEGVAGPETANNAYANASMVPLLTLGIPSSPTIAVLMGAFIVNGLTPGPFLFQEKPELVWTIIASFFVGNVLLLILNLPLVGLWAKILDVPYQYICVGTLLFCILGAYSINQSVFDIWIMLLFGVIGYVLRKLDFPLAPAVLGIILGPQLEKSLRTSLEMSAGDYSIFFTRPISAGLLVCSVIILAVAAFNLAPKEIREGGSE